MTSQSALKDDRDKRHRAPLAEWVVGAIGLVLVATTITVLIYEAVQSESSPPRISVSVIDVRPQPEGYLVEIRVTNAGGTTAGALNIEGSLTSGDVDVETSEATIDYVAAKSERTAGLFFSRDPRRFQLRVRPTGYQEP